MAAYKFENHTGELIDPKIEKLSTYFSIGQETVRVSATLIANGNKLYGVDLGEMENSDNWTDADVTAWAEKKILEYKV